MNQQERDELRKKHKPLEQSQGAIGAVTYCIGCKSPSGVMTTLWPCDVVKLLKATS